MLGNFERIRANRAGNVAVLTALLLPVLVMIAGFTIDYISASSKKSALQSAADAAAIGSARELALGHAGSLVAVAKAIATHALSGQQSKTEPQIQAVPTKDRTGVRVTITQEIKGLFPMFGAGDKTLVVSAVARASGPKLCLLGLDPSQSGTIQLAGNAALTAEDCAAFSNSTASSGVAVKASAVLTANLICSAGGFEGGTKNLVGSRMPDCPAIADPLAGRPPPPVGSCAFMTRQVITRDSTLSPGVYCGGIEIRRNAKVTLSRGIYVIKNGPLIVRDNGTIQGDDVGFYFLGPDSRFEFTASAGIDLSAPTNGVMAGILIFGDRSAPDVLDYRITSNDARRLIGTIYLPRGTLSVDAGGRVADRSAFTVIVARRLSLSRSPNLILNADYHKSTVPVPAGLGPSTSIVLTN